MNVPDPIVNDKTLDLFPVERTESLESQVYDFDQKADKAARDRGLVVVTPRDNDIQLDLDTEEAYLNFLKRFEAMDLDCEAVQIRVSASGLPHRHVCIALKRDKDDIVEDYERIALQAALGSDPVREYLNVMRIRAGIINPSRLFERPDENCIEKGYIQTDAEKLL